VANEQEVVETLRPFGFEAISTEGMTLEGQISLFSEAGFIVGLHGAGLTNALFAPRGTRVIEFMSPIPAYLNACYYSLCSSVGHRYMFILGRHSSSSTVSSGVRRWREDLEVPIDTLLTGIRMLQAG
jgi:capsular polysaccharide biosynthesis protein